MLRIITLSLIAIAGILILLNVACTEVVGHVSQQIHPWHSGKLVSMIWLCVLDTAVAKRL